MTTALTATVQSTYGRVLLQVTFTTVTSATVSRVHADGSVYAVRGGAPVKILSTSGVGAVLFDHEAPLDVAVTYKAVNGATTVTSSAVTVPSDTGDLGSRCWLTHPLRPSLSQMVRVEAMGERSRPARVGVLRVIGRADPIAVTDVRVSGAGELTATTYTAAEATALEALCADGGVLLLRCPGTWRSPWQYIAVGDLSEVSAAGHAQDLTRTWRLPYTVVAAPSGTGLAATGSSYADAKAAYATYALLKAGETTYNDLKIKAGP